MRRVFAKTIDGAIWVVHSEDYINQTLDLVRACDCDRNGNYGANAEIFEDVPYDNIVATDTNVLALREKKPNGVFLMDD
jgi:hypothetical protein